MTTGRTEFQVTLIVHSKVIQWPHSSDVIELFSFACVSQIIALGS